MAAVKEFRSTGHDVAPVSPKAIPKKPGTLPDHQIAIYDNQGRMRGRVHAGATSATVARFTGQHGAKLGKVDVVGDGHGRGECRMRQVQPERAHFRLGGQPQRAMLGFLAPFL